MKANKPEPRSKTIFFAAVGRRLGLLLLLKTETMSSSAFKAFLSARDASLPAAYFSVFRTSLSNRAALTESST